MSSILPGERTFQENHSGRGHLPGSTDNELGGLLVDGAGAWSTACCSLPRQPRSIGRGKVEEIAALSNSADADTVVFDEELTDSIATSKLFGRTAIDRAVIVFARRAALGQGAKVQLALCATAPADARPASSTSRTVDCSKPWAR